MNKKPIRQVQGKPGWIIEFNKEFPWVMDGRYNQIRVELKSFIQYLLSEERAKEREKIMEEIMEMGEIALKESDNQQDFMVRFFDRLRNMSTLLDQLSKEGKLA